VFYFILSDLITGSLSRPVCRIRALYLALDPCQNRMILTNPYKLNCGEHPPSADPSARSLAGVRDGRNGRAVAGSDSVAAGGAPGTVRVSVGLGMLHLHPRDSRRRRAPEKPNRTNTAVATDVSAILATLLLTKAVTRNRCESARSVASARAPGTSAATSESTRWLATEKTASSELEKKALTPVNTTMAATPANAIVRSILGVTVEYKSQYRRSRGRRLEPAEQRSEPLTCRDRELSTTARVPVETAG